MTRLQLLPLVLGLAVLAGCGGRSPTTTPSGTAGVRPGETSLEPIRDALRQDADLPVYRSVLQQVNAYLTGQSEKPALTTAERELLSGQLGLEKDDLTEVESVNFTLLDAHYLDSSRLLHDAARSLGVDGLAPLARAEAGFTWVIRQVWLYERPGTPVPPAYVLRRGYGTSLERTFLFLEVLRHLDLEGCVVTVPAKNPNDPPMYWAAGVLIDKQVYLFDTRLGVQLPAPDGKKPATLAGLKAAADPFPLLKGNGKEPYDVTAEQLKKAEVLLACGLSSLAPRMKFLEKVLTDQERAVRMAVDAPALLQHFRDAGFGESVRFWPYATGLLKSFLPPEEGGSDRPDNAGRGRAVQMQLELIPLDRFPEKLQSLPPVVKSRLYGAFAKLCMFYSLEDPSKKNVVTLRDQQGASADVQMDDAEAARVAIASGFDVFKRTESDQRGGATRESQLPRALMLRGRLDEATKDLVKARDRVRKELADLRSVTRLDQDVDAWLARAAAVYPRGTPQPTAALRQREMGLWMDAAPVGMLIHRAAAPVIYEEVSYLLALCKHEQAERAQARLTGRAPTPVEAKATAGAWRSAADLWQAYLNDHPAGPRAAAARLHRARALALQGQTEAARQLLQDPQDLTPLEQIGRQVRILQLQHPK